MRILEKASECFRLFGGAGRSLRLPITSFSALGTCQLPIGKAIYLRFQSSDQCVYQEVILDKDYEFDLGFTPTVIVDVGANIGLCAVFFANRYPTAEIIAIEPEDSNFAILEKNVRCYKQITPIHAALWTHEGSIHLSAPLEERGKWDKWGVITSENGSGEEVRALSLRSLIDQFKLPRIDLLKIDIEGSEMEIFSACDWLPLIMPWRSRPMTVSGLEALMLLTLLSANFRKLLSEEPGMPQSIRVEVSSKVN